MERVAAIARAHGAELLGLVATESERLERRQSKPRTQGFEFGGEFFAQPATLARARPLAARGNIRLPIGAGILAVSFDVSHDVVARQLKQ